MTFEEERLLADNASLGAALIWQTTKTFSGEADNETGLPINLIMLVLPLTLHKATASAISRASKKSGLSQILKYDRTFRADISQRTKLLSGLTWNALLLADASGLVNVNNNQGAISVWLQSTIKDLPAIVKPSAESTKEMFKLADRLGYWFFHESDVTIADVIPVLSAV